MMVVAGTLFGVLALGLLAGCGSASTVERGVDAATEAEKLVQESETRAQALEEARTAAE